MNASARLLIDGRCPNETSNPPPKACIAMAVPPSSTFSLFTIDSMHNTLVDQEEWWSPQHHLIFCRRLDSTVFQLAARMDLFQNKPDLRIKKKGVKYCESDKQFSSVYS